MLLKKYQMPLSRSTGSHRGCSAALAGRRVAECNVGGCTRQPVFLLKMLYLKHFIQNAGILCINLLHLTTKRSGGWGDRSGGNACGRRPWVA